MNDVFNLLFGNNQKSIRRRTVLKPTSDVDGQPIVEAIEGETISLSPDGSIDSIQVVPDRFFHCGCTAEKPMGGRCQEGGCNRVSCTQCFSRCKACGLPLCLEHRFMAIDDAGREVVLCRRCKEAMQRGRIMRGVLSPLIDFKETRK